jgi:hypothetical protein
MNLLKEEKERNNMSEQNKPLIIRMEEAKIELRECVNNILQKNGLNCYLFEPTFADMYSQIKMGAQQELMQTKSQINTETKECCGHENCKCGHEKE